MLERDGKPERHDAELKERADRALRAGNAVEALSIYGALLRHVTVLDAGLYDAWLDGALDACRALGRNREAGYILIALRRFPEAERCFDAERTPHEWALCAAAQGRSREASRVLANIGYSALAAITLETAGDWGGARHLWEAVLREDRLRPCPYETALVRFNLGQALRRLGDAEAARRELTHTQKMIEEMADDFETQGDRDRAFDCYTLLLRLGKDAGAFENVAEGYLNVIRLLAGSDYKFTTVLEYYEDFLEFAASQQEWHAAAMLAQEAADFSARLGLVYERHYRQRAASLWNEVARHNTLVGGPAEVTENALVAAVDAAVATRDLPVVGRLYSMLAELPLGRARKDRYTSLARRHRSGGESPPPGPSFPEYFRRRDAYPEIWRQHLLEWELDGRPVPVLVQLVAERLEFVPSARLALRALLICAGEAFSLEDADAASELALALGRVQAYEVLRPIEQLASHAAAKVRAAAMAGAGKVPMKKTFAIIRRGLVDPDETVRIEARRSLRAMTFRDAFEPLARLYREGHDELMRQTIIEAIGEIHSLEAGLFLMDLIRCETGVLAELAARRLRAFPVSEVWPVVRRRAEMETGEVRATLERLLSTARESV